MAGRYELWLTDDYGFRLSAEPMKDVWFNASREVNSIAYAIFGFPASFDESLLNVDFMIQVWHAPEGERASL